MEPEIALARTLYEAMERLDPSSAEDPLSWESLPERDREFYRHCVRAMLADDEIVLAALSERR